MVKILQLDKGYLLLFLIQSPYEVDHNGKKFNWRNKNYIRTKH